MKNTHEGDDKISMKELSVERARSILDYLCGCKCEEGTNLEDFAPKVRELDECIYNYCCMQNFDPRTVTPCPWSIYDKRAETEGFILRSPYEARWTKALFAAARDMARSAPALIQEGKADYALKTCCKFVWNIEGITGVQGSIWKAMNTPKQIICIMGRSGSGKSTLESTLESLGYERIISCTTRPPRGNERDGVEYHFVSREKFAGLIENGSLMEYAEYNGNLYGSPKPVALKNVVVLEPQGYANLKKMYPQTLGVFIYLPEDVIVQRLSGRKDTSPEEIARRMAGDKEVFADIQEKADFVLDGRMPIKEAVEAVICMAKQKGDEWV